MPLPGSLQLYHLLPLLIFMQMMSLYKDPEGKYAFDNRNHDSQDTSVSVMTTKTDKIEPKRVQELELKAATLERVLREHQVSCREESQLCILCLVLVIHL